VYKRQDIEALGTEQIAGDSGRGIILRAEAARQHGNAQQNA